MERKTIDTLISGLIICMFFILGILYQFSIIAMHYVFGYITYVIIAIAFIISFLSNVELRKRIICD